MRPANIDGHNQFHGVEMRLELDGKKVLKSNGYDRKNSLDDRRVLAGNGGMEVNTFPSGFEVNVMTTRGATPSDAKVFIDLPSGARVHELGNVLYFLKGGEAYGSIDRPVLKNPNGPAIPLAYTWSDGVLKISVPQAEEGEMSEVGILAFSWTYTMSAALNKSPYRTWTLLHNCFNCYFPVAGAPRSFPSHGQLLPLYAWFSGKKFNMECRMGSAILENWGWTYRFNATANHFDGAGSYITFSSGYDSVTGKYMLYVRAYITRVWATSHPFYTTSAKAKWREFANRLNAA